MRSSPRPLPISIHAPREGSDIFIFLLLRLLFGFQSTLPARGATLPKAGCRMRGSYFNPRSPRGERLPPMIHGSINIRISIHAPREGSDDSASSKVFSISISIHAPREGSDQITYFYSRVCRYFNPRSPRGERPFEGGQNEQGKEFQSTLPARGATPMESKNCRIESFQSTLPARGATHIEAAKNMQIKYFNPRSPRGERRFPALVQASLDCISIHAPREGSDHFFSRLFNEMSYFNPRSPRGERRYLGGQQDRDRDISIHAPREGSDNRQHEKPMGGT